MNGNIPRMDYRQYPGDPSRLVHESFNYDSGTACCWDGEPLRVCTEYQLFLLAGLPSLSCPLDEALEAALLRRGSRNAALSAGVLLPKIQPGKYCPDCAGRMKRINAAKRKRKQREKCHALGHFKPA